MSQVSLWQDEQQSAQYAELCNALYERELRALASIETTSLHSIQGRLKSLSYYVKRTAHLMTQAQTPLELDVQNASWSAKQTKLMPLTGQLADDIWQWYQSFTILPGLVVPIQLSDRIVIDSVDRIDHDNHRFRTNAYGWFNYQRVVDEVDSVKLLKPNKKIMSSACAGHCWCPKGAIRPMIPSMRELLLSCSINWRNFKRPATL